MRTALERCRIFIFFHPFGLDRVRLKVQAVIFNQLAVMGIASDIRFTKGHEDGVFGDGVFGDGVSDGGCVDGKVGFLVGGRGNAKAEIVSPEFVTVVSVVAESQE